MKFKIKAGGTSMGVKGVAARAVAVVTVLITALALSAGAASAHGNTYDVHIQHAHDGYCLDSNYNGDVYLNPCQSGNTYQMWNIVNAQSGHFEIQDAQTGRCLYVTWTWGSPVNTDGCNWQSPIDNWAWQTGEYSSEFYNDYATMCLDGNAYSDPQVYETGPLGSCQWGNPYQNWNPIFM